jgi:Trypsin-like peptidase domain
MNIPSDVNNGVARATFKIQTKRATGQCVLVEGGFIITASHCVEWDNSGLMALEKPYLNKIKTVSGNLIAQTRAVEPVSDIAVLGSPDSQTFYHESVVFDELCERVAPVKLLRSIPKSEFPVWIRTHRKTWVAGMAIYRGGNSSFAYKTDIKLSSGTSGGPIVNHNGELVGVVSNCTSTSDGGKYTSTAGLLPLALPVWVIARTKHH